MHVLLTGSSGWLGRFLAPALRAVGHRVLGLDVAPGADTEIVGSVADRRIVDEAFGHGVEAVIHAGALHKPDIARYDEQAFIDVNISGTLNLVKAATSAKCDRFVLTSTTSLMISRAIRNSASEAAVWLDENTAPLQPRNIYGVTKLAAEHLCRMYAENNALPCIVLRTSRFFPEEDDTDRTVSGANLKANELLYRRLTVQDAARAHIAALEKAPELGFGTFIASALSPFQPGDAHELKQNAPAVIARYFPDAEQLYAGRGWTLPQTINRIYDARLADDKLGFRCETDFAAVLNALRAGEDPPLIHDASYLSPKEAI